MRLLLDTHLALLAVTTPERLTSQAEQLVDDPNHDIHVSVVSIWEIAIKHALQRGFDPMPLWGHQAAAEFKTAGFELIEVSAEHAAFVDLLPPLHGDPFDRVLVAQALSYPLKLVTHDRRVAAYSNGFLLV